MNTKGLGNYKSEWRPYCSITRILTIFNPHPVKIFSPLNDVCISRLLHTFKCKLQIHFTMEANAFNPDQTAHKVSLRSCLTDMLTDDNCRERC